MEDIIKVIGLLVIAFVLAGTCPSKSDHCHEIFNEVRANVDNAFQKLAVSLVEDSIDNDDLCKLLDLEYKNYWVCSVMMRKDGSKENLFSVGVFHKVWVLK